MHEIDVSQTDLNLLVVLDVLLQERNVTRAARRLHRTQSAVSHALGRLRAQLGDPLLVRVGGEMRPTPKAERLAGEISRLLRSIGRVLAQEGAFDPATTDRVFTLAGPDFVAAVLPTLLAGMATTTPTAGVELVPAVRGMLRDVADGRVDLAIAPAGLARTEGLRSLSLATLEWAVYARADHPAVGVWGLEAWAGHSHVRVRTTSGEESPVETAARAAGLHRRAGPYLPHFLLAPPLLARTDLLMTVPRAVLADVAPRFGLVALPCPLSLSPIALSMFWSAALDGDPAIVWFRRAVEAAARVAFASTGEALELRPRTSRATAGRASRKR
ncbi:LysR family transcriptional regulator [Myxococcota bacterium]|nr:LysR family transcriptional regulator [Myxococcota bacterium]